MWPPNVERIAAALRAAGVEGRLEELSKDARVPPGPAVRAETYDCDGRRVVALIPVDRDLDRSKLARAARCSALRPVDPLRFPFTNAVVVLERIVLVEPAVWIEAGSPRHTVALAPPQLVDLANAQTADLVTDS